MSLSPSRRHALLAVGIAAAVVLVDQLTKQWAVNRLSGGRTVDVVGSLRFNLTFNSGMAFSRGTGLGPVIGIVALVVVVLLLASLRRNDSVLSTIGLGLVIGGAIGNVLDRLFRSGSGSFLGGSVVDFIDLQWWPVFNVADAAITVGGVILVVGALVGSKKARRRRVTSEVLSEVVPAALDGERLDRVVSLLTGCSRSAAAELVGAGAVDLDGTVAVAGKVRVAKGQVVVVRPGAAAHSAAPEADAAVPVVVVHEDHDVIVVDKQAGVVVHPGAGNERGTLVAGLLARYPELAGVGDPTRPGLVHRLDRETSGLLIVARTATAYDTLVAALAARRVTRRYAALVWGVPEPPQGIVDAPIGRSPRHPLRQAVVAGGRPARTRYTVRTVYTAPAPVALLDCELETGRTHQIRVHAQAIGHPVVGDRDYGGERGRIVTPRLFLHAEHLAFDHPVTGTTMSFDAALPDDLVAVLASLTPA